MPGGILSAFFRIALVLATALLCACSLTPTVQYRELNGPDDMNGMTDAFYLQRSVLMISLASTDTKNAAGAHIKLEEISITSSPREYRDVKYGIRAIKHWWSSTVVSLDKVANTELISSASVEVTDTVAKTINEFGSATSKLITLATLKAPAEPPPQCIAPDATLTVDLSEKFTSNTERVTLDGSTAGSQCVTLELQKRPVDSIERKLLPTNVDTHNYYYAACRDAKVTIRQHADQEITKMVRVADPRYLQFVQFPPKGAVSAHSACGISVKTEKTVDVSPSSVADALATQAKAIKDALDAASRKH